MKVSQVDTWVVGVKDKSGEAATKLDALAKAGINLEFVIARRSPETPGTGVVFVTPIKGAAKKAAAKAAGFTTSKSLNTIRVEGKDKKGRGAKITLTLADAGINLRGFSAAAIGKKFLCHIALDSADDVAKAMKALKRL